MILLSSPHSCLILAAASLFRDQDTKMSAKMSSKELKSIFEKYAAREGDPNQLSKNELTLLIQTEFPSLLKGPSTLEDLFKELDKNGDGEVSFEEFQVVLNKIAQ
ncbi:protein S100-G [Rhinolophus sinicus]|uniref:protein S100-G n=1 Tax=Rhinolophus sinicus TaxID=89399 RepID=UPI0009442681|nr:PREDICTED: protein S100-G [Rhinolophus sinicus]